MNTKPAAANRCYSAVSATALTQQQIDQNTRPKPGAKKSYRPSSASKTLRVPYELISQVNALIAAYRAQQRNDPDTY